MSVIADAGLVAARPSLREALQARVSQIVVAPSFALVLFFVYGFIFWTIYVSFSESRMLPNYTWAGIDRYVQLWNTPRWHTAITNLFLFGGSFIALCMAIGLALAVMLDQRIRAEGALRTIYLYPMALSFIVSGTAWKWILNPGTGLEAYFKSLGWDVSIGWLTDSQMAIWCLVLAAVWQSSGFVMALFLAGLRGVDQEIVKAAYLDGATLPKIYMRIIIPSIRPVFLSALVVLAHLAIKSFDLVKALTNGGPGTSTDLPATFMHNFTFERNQLGIGAASAVMMLCTVMAVIVPYLYSELRGAKRG